MNSAALDVSNNHLVGSIPQANRVVIAAPPASPVLDPADALVLAAWLVRIAEPIAGVTFAEIQSAVANS